MCPRVDSACENEYQGFLRGKGGRCVRLTIYHPRSAESQENPTRNPLGHLGLLRDELYVYRRCQVLMVVIL